MFTRCFNYITILGPAEEIKRFVEANTDNPPLFYKRGKKPRNDIALASPIFTLHAFLPVPAKVLAAGETPDTGRRNAKQYGYEWMMENWGTEWDATHEYITPHDMGYNEEYPGCELRFSFMGKAQPPHKWFEAVVAAFPALTLYLEYSSSDACFRGWYLGAAGKVSHQHYDIDDSEMYEPPADDTQVVVDQDDGRPHDIPNELAKNFNTVEGRKKLIELYGDKNTSYIPVAAMEDRIKNIHEVIDFKQKGCEKAAKSLQERISKATPEEMAIRIPELIREYEKLHHELEILKSEMNTLEHVLQQDAVVPNAAAKESSSAVPVRIEQFRDEFAFLSNFANIKVRMDGIEYPTAENAFQAYKSDERYVRLKMAQITPAEAKKLGRKLSLPENWNDIRLGVMSAIVYQKFLQNPDAKDKLLATGDAILQERNTWGDTFWGADMAGVGENHLGEILMAVRAKLRNDGA